jgi:hypothetical protein
MFLKNTFGVAKWESLHINEFWLWIQNSLAPAHFEEAVDDNEEFLATGEKRL